VLLRAQPKLPARRIEPTPRLGLPRHVTSWTEEADMWRRQKALARLDEELRIIALFDRIHDYVPEPGPADDSAYAFRQIRRSQIMAEISKVKTSRPEYRNLARISSAVILLGAVGYATFHYLLK
jgi:hypothetical protein